MAEDWKSSLAEAPRVRKMNAEIVGAALAAIESPLIVGSQLKRLLHLEMIFLETLRSFIFKTRWAQFCSFTPTRDSGSPSYWRSCLSRSPFAGAWSRKGCTTALNLRHR